MKFLVTLRLLFFAFLAPLALAVPAAAHVRSETIADWEISGADASLTLTVPVIEAQRLADTATPVLDSVLKRYLSDRIYPVAHGRRCALVPPVETLASTSPGFRKFSFTWRCAEATDVQIHFGAFFDLVSSHTNFAQIQNVATGEFTEELITADRQTIDVTAGEGAALQRAGFLEFVEMGIMHIFTGVDHMSFLIGLVLLSTRLRDLVFVVTGFTIGHSLTLALAVTGILRPQAEYIDALVALTIVLIGAENLAVATRRPGLVAGGLVVGLGAMGLCNLLGLEGLPFALLLGGGMFSAGYLIFSSKLQSPGRLRMVITLVFGLIHGFGFAANLLAMQLPKQRLAELLVGFNLGVEAGQVTLVLGVSLLAYFLVRIKFAPPRALVVETCSGLLIGVGVFWLVERSFV